MATGKFPVSAIPKADADTLDGQDSAAFAGTGHNHDGTYSPTGHGHSGADITSGEVDEARIDADIARDSELGGSHNHDGGEITTGTVDAARIDDAIAARFRVTDCRLGSFQHIGSL